MSRNNGNISERKHRNYVKGNFVIPLSCFAGLKNWCFSPWQYNHTSQPAIPTSWGSLSRYRERNHFKRWKKKRTKKLRLNLSRDFGNSFLQVSVSIVAVSQLGEEKDKSAKSLSDLGDDSDVGIVHPFLFSAPRRTRLVSGALSQESARVAAYSLLRFRWDQNLALQPGDEKWEFLQLIS